MSDLRFKLTDEDRKEIKKLWAEGFCNYSYLGNKFGVHPKTIRKVIDDNYRQECNKFNRENWRKFKPTREHHAELMREYRKRKRNYENN